MNQEPAPVAASKPRRYCSKCNSPYAYSDDHENSISCEAQTRYNALQAAGYVCSADTSTASIARNWLLDFGYGWAIRNEKTAASLPGSGLVTQAWVPGFVEKLVHLLRWDDHTWFRKKRSEQQEIVKAALAGALDGFVPPEIK